MPTIAMPNDAGNSSHCITVAEWNRRNKHTTRIQIIKRLLSLTNVKLELEAQNDRLRRKAKQLGRRLETANTVLFRKGDACKALYLCEDALRRARLRMKELGARIKEKCNDYERLHRTIEKFRPELRCVTCNVVKSVKCFAKDPDKLLGIDNRCKPCLREKTRRWRASKKFHGVA